jgi:hypothetical protein
MFKHVGVIKNTGKKCVILFLEIPGRETHALVVEPDSLPDMLHDHVMSLLESAEGQAATNFGEVLGRRFLADKNTTVLEELHNRRYLQPVPHTNIVMMPGGNNRVEMAEVMNALRKMRQGQNFAETNFANEHMSGRFGTDESYMNDSYANRTMPSTMPNDMFQETSNLQHVSQEKQENSNLENLFREHMEMIKLLYNDLSNRVRQLEEIANENSKLMSMVENMKKELGMNSNSDSVSVLSRSNEKIDSNNSSDSSDSNHSNESGVTNKKMKKVK